MALKYLKLFKKLASERLKYPIYQFLYSRFSRIEQPERITVIHKLNRRLWEKNQAIHAEKSLRLIREQHERRVMLNNSLIKISERLENE